MGFLSLFEFIENTGATTESIGRLFEILATPGLGQPAKFYEELYQAPNIYVEFKEVCDEHVGVITQRWLRNHVEAAYMYHQRQLNPETGPTNKEIMEKTGFRTSAAIRRVYNSIKASGLLPAACDYMEKDHKKKRGSKPHSVTIAEYTSGRYKAFKELYDAVCERYEQSIKQSGYIELCLQIASEMGIATSNSAVVRHFKNIETLFSTDRLSKLRRLASEANAKAAEAAQLQRDTQRGLLLYERMLQIVSEYRHKGEIPPNPASVRRLLAKEENVGASRIETLLWLATKRLKEQAEQAQQENDVN